MAMERHEKALMFLSGIVVPVVLALVGWWIITVQADQTDRVISQQQEAELSQRNTDRVAVLLPSLASENPAEKEMAFAFIEYLEDKGQLPAEVEPLLKEFWNREATAATLQATAPGSPAVRTPTAIERVARLFPRVYIHIPSESLRPRVRDVTKLLEQHKFTVPGIQLVDNAPGRTELRYFRENEAQEARRIVELLETSNFRLAAKYIHGYKESAGIRPRHYELWFGRGSNAGPP